jgi:hypothetical protein
MAAPDELHLLCHRCGGVLTPGRGDFYVVRIEAIADPSPPNLSEEDFCRDIAAEIDRLIEQMSHMSHRELMEQVYRRLTIHLCGPCYRRWIEDPAGSA